MNESAQDMTPTSPANEQFICLDKATLAKKSFPHQLLITGFEYMLTGLIGEYSRINDIENATDYNNSKKKMRLDHILAHPFFVAVANGNTESLSYLFGDFYTLSFGIVSMPIFEMIKPDAKTKFNCFDVNDSNGHSIKFKNSIASTDFNAIKENIKSTKIEFGQNYYDFSRIEIINDDEKRNTLFDAIDVGIETIRYQAESILAGDNDTINFKARYFAPYRLFHSDGVRRKITISDIMSSEKPFPTVGSRSRPMPKKQHPPQVA